MVRLVFDQEKLKKCRKTNLFSIAFLIDLKNFPFSDVIKGVNFDLIGFRTFGGKFKLFLEHLSKSRFDLRNDFAIRNHYQMASMSKHKPLVF